MPPQEQNNVPKLPTEPTNSVTVTPPVQKPESENNVDPSSFLLPKKDTTSPATATRVNAGVLLQQEQTATLEKPHAPTPEVSKQPPTEPKPQSSVRPLETYRGDIERAVAGGASVVSIAAAEAERRNAPGQQTETTPAEPSHLWRNLGYVVLGLVLLSAGGGVFVYYFTRTAPVAVQQAPEAPFMFVDSTTLVQEPATLNRDEVMAHLDGAKQNTQLAVGLINWLYPSQVDATGAQHEVPITQLLQTLAPRAPGELLRTLKPDYLLGVHSYDQNQPFLILHVDEFQTAYAAMLQWEYTMAGELAPLFSRDPSPKLPSEQTLAVATTSQAFVPTSFVDKVVENQDARVLYGSQGDIILLWVMLGRDKIIITTNQYTLREIISRMNQTPTIPLNTN